MAASGTTLSAEQLERRRRVMARSMALGHCICDAKSPCPCNEFKRAGRCHCAGEMGAESVGELRLTEHVRNPGCSSKVPKRVLQEVLKGLPEVSDARVMIGAAAGDDAGVMVLSADVASILTVDVFCPSVDDPYLFGQIAAANSLSDIYAMGGVPQAALSIVGYPTSTLPASGMREMLRGGAETMKEAGVAVIGGHSMQDEQIFCGFAVLGTARLGEIVRNSGAKVGDAIVLTKPLGGGIVMFGRQIGRASAEQLAEVARAGATLNKAAGMRLAKFGAHAATDVTGFSLLGHAAEIVKNSHVAAEIQMGAVPLFDGVRELAAKEVLPGAVERNRESVEAGLVEWVGVSAGEQGILFCPETSGGMLIFLPAGKAGALVTELAAEGVSAAVIGRVVAEHARGLIRVRGNAGDRAMESAKGDVAACCCPNGEAATTPADALPAAAPEAFGAYMKAVSGAGAIDLKHKKLMAVALSVAQKCGECVTINAQAARDAGASEAEIGEAAALGIAFGGAPCAKFYEGLRRH